MESNIAWLGFVIFGLIVLAWSFGQVRPKTAIGLALGVSIIAAGLTYYTARPGIGGSKPPQELLDAADRAEAAQRR